VCTCSSRGVAVVKCLWLLGELVGMHIFMNMCSSGRRSGVNSCVAKAVRTVDGDYNGRFLLSEPVCLREHENFQGNPTHTDKQVHHWESCYARIRVVP